MVTLAGNIFVVCGIDKLSGLWNYSHVPHNEVSVNDRPWIRQ